MADRSTTAEHLRLQKIEQSTFTTLVTKKKQHYKHKFTSAIKEIKSFVQSI
jgi:hypothetical protein